MLKSIARACQLILMQHVACKKDVGYLTVAVTRAYRLQEVKIFGTACLNKPLLKGKASIYPNIS